MKKIAPPPYDDFYVYDPVWHKKERRRYVALRNINTKKLTTTSYARYLMSVHLGRKLNKNETVDHINNDRSDDRIENLQILSLEENLKKYQNGIESKVNYVKLVCTYCNCEFERAKSRTKNKENKNVFCSRKCCGKYYYSDFFKKTNSIAVENSAKNRRGISLSENHKKNISEKTTIVNQGKKRNKKGSTSKYVGVSLDKKRGKWRSAIAYKRKVITIGRFETEIEAALAYNKKAIEIYGNNANLNIIE